MTYKPDIVIYHANCDDGFGAAFAAWMRWGDDIEYVPAHYGSAPPEVLDKHVLIVDFSYKAEGLRSLDDAASVTILDHHKSAAEDLAQYRRFADSPWRFTMPVAVSMAEDLRRGGYPPINALFDLGRSGAVLAWEFCHPGEPIPYLLRLIQDRDLWKFEDPDTRAFSLFLRSCPYDFLEWHAIADMLDDAGQRHTLMNEARSIERYQKRLVEDVARHHDLVAFPGVEGMVPVAASPYRLASDVAHQLLMLHPEAPFAATVNHRASTVGYSLRSEDHRLDVSKIAQRYGGGGHRNAAGFSIPKP